MAWRSIENALNGQADMLADVKIQERTAMLIEEARITLTAIRNCAESSSRDALIDPVCLSKAVKRGILDAPHLKNNPFAPGTIQTRIINGACEAVDEKGEFINETKRLEQYL
jgi:hypothetical protein